jgi:hypothetical protein
MDFQGKTAFKKEFRKKFLGSRKKKGFDKTIVRALLEVVKED